MSDGLDPRKPFFMCVRVANIDGTFEMRGENADEFATLDEALVSAREGVDQYGDEAYIFDCRPVRRITRGPIRVESVRDRKGEDAKRLSAKRKSPAPKGRRPK